VQVHVERCAGQMTRLESLQQRQLVNDTAAGEVDQEAATLHASQLVGADQTASATGQRHVEAEEVGTIQHLIG
jgi:hypothetical protein